MNDRDRTGAEEDSKMVRNQKRESESKTMIESGIEPGEEWAAVGKPKKTRRPWTLIIIQDRSQLFKVQIVAFDKTVVSSSR